MRKLGEQFRKRLRPSLEVFSRLSAPLLKPGCERFSLARESLLKRDEDYLRRVEQPGELAGKLEMSGAAVDAKCRDVVASGMANIQEIPKRLDSKVAGIIALRPELL